MLGNKKEQLCGKIFNFYVYLHLFLFCTYLQLIHKIDSSSVVCMTTSTKQAYLTHGILSMWISDCHDGILLHMSLNIADKNTVNSPISNSVKTHSKVEMSSL